MNKRPRPRAIQHYLQSNNTLQRLAGETAKAKALHQQLIQQLPAELAEHVSAVRQRRQILVIYTDSPAWASRLRYLIPRIRSQLPGYLEYRIRVQPPSVDDRTAHQRKARGLNQATADLLAQTAENVSDPGLSRALKRLAAHGGKTDLQY